MGEDVEASGECDDDGSENDDDNLAVVEVVRMNVSLMAMVICRLPSTSPDSPKSPT